MMGRLSLEKERVKGLVNPKKRLVMKKSTGGGGGKKRQLK